MKPENEDAGQRHRDRMARNSRNAFESVADIGELPAVKDPTRKESCRLDLHLFLKSYFPNTTGLSPFSDDHNRVISRLKGAVLRGGRSYNLVYRGFAKTTISVNTCLWALAYGHRRMIVLIGANRAAAKDLLDALQSELETNELLLEDFPEICVAIRALEGKVQRCASQTHDGRLTNIEWTKERIVFPTIAGSICSGSCVVTRGITSSIRGLGHRRADGTQQRPDLVIGDDLQTDASAASALQVRKRLMTLSKSILKLAGHNASIACVVNGTIIEPDDLMDRIRDPMQYPGWQGETVKMVRRWSDAHETHWLGEYARLRKSFDPAMPDDKDRARKEATEFYRRNQKVMDAGCEISWEHCYDPELELSAIQHAYNFLIDDGEEVFAAECQSDPLKQGNESEQLRASDVIHKLSGLARYEVPKNTVLIACHIDVQDESLWYTVIAFTANFTGYVIDYGVWPDQKTFDVSKKRLRTTLTKKYKELRNPEARWRQALSDLCDQVLGRNYVDADKREYSVTAAFVDVADGDSAIPLRSWIRTSKWNKILRASMGLGLKPADKPLGERRREEDELRRGLNWLEKRDKKIRGGSIIWIDVNYWKSFLVNRWRAGSPRPKHDASYRPDEPGALYLWGVDSHSHSTFGSHQCSESSVTLSHEKSGRSISFFTLKPNRPDNEWFDNCVACCVLADYSGRVSLKDSGLKSAPIARSRGPREAEYL